MAGLAKVGGEILVNSTVAGNQVSPEAIRLDSGDVAIGWSTEFPASLEHFGRIYSNGAPATAEFQIDSSGTFPLRNPSLAPTEDGGFVSLTYRAGVNGSYSSQGKVVDDQGNVVGSFAGPSNPGDPMMVVSTPIDPQITRLNSGDFFFSFTDDGDGSDISGWLFSLDDPANPTVISVNALTAATQQDSDVAALSSGGFVVTWEDNSGLGGDASGFGVRAQLFDATGAKVGSEFLVNTSLTGNQADAAVTALASGFVITWVDSSGDASGAAIKAQRFDASGAKLGGEINVNTTTNGDQVSPTIVDHPSGGFVIAWEDASAGTGDTSGRAIRAQLFDFTGARVGGELVVNTTTTGDQTTPSIAVSGDGDLLVTWVDSSQTGGDTSGKAIRAQLLELDIADELHGTSGPDIFIIDDPDDVIFDNTNNDGDRALASVSYVLSPSGARVENLEAADPFATTAINLTGNGIRNNLFGNAGNNVLDGGEDIDRMTGYGGDDTYFVDAAADLAIEAVGEGNDTVIARISYALRANNELENLRLFDPTSTVGFVLSGNEFANEITGGAGNNRIDGLGGADRMIGLGGDDLYIVSDEDDVVVEANGGGNDAIQTNVAYTLAAGVSVEYLKWLPTAAAAIDLTGNEFAQRIDGSNGNNRIDGGAGADTLVGYLGDDTYVVDNVGDRVGENANGGIDTVLARSSWALNSSSSVEQIRTIDQAATTAINLYGNELAQAINGNAGNNYLDGGGGVDRLTGFAGNDQYVVDSLGDIVVEAAGQGTDVVWATGTYVLGAGVSVEVLSTKVNAGTQAINLYGNELVNTLYGNAGANRLDGGGGADVLRGLGGNDSYYIDNAGDVVVEATGEGNDAIWSRVSYTLAAGVQVESLSTYAHAGTEAINLTGNEIANTVYGNAGVNTLNGGRGADTMTGFAGNDTFAFTTPLGGGNVDRIVDFAPGADKIALENAVFTGLPAGALAAGAFNTGAAATQADDRIIYNSATGALFFDSDGTGAAVAVQFASVNAGLALGAGDFIVI